MKNPLRSAGQLIRSAFVLRETNNNNEIRRAFQCSLAVLVTFFLGPVYAADVVPTDIQQPGTQPGEVGNLESPDKCDNCHGGYNDLVEPAFTWRGSAKAYCTLYRALH